MRRLGRFFNLEQRRTGRNETPSPGSGERARRFTRVEAPTELQALDAPRDTHLRFDEPPPPTRRPEPGEPSFTRCAACGADNNLHASTCHSCQTGLRTEAQYAFHEAFWEKRRAELLAQEEGQAEAGPAASSLPALPTPAVGASDPSSPALLRGSQVHLLMTASLGVLLFLLGYGASRMRTHPTPVQAPRTSAEAVPIPRTLTTDGVDVMLAYAQLERRADRGNVQDGLELGPDEAWLSVRADLRERQGTPHDVSWTELVRLEPAPSPHRPARALSNGGLPARIATCQAGVRCAYSYSRAPLHLSPAEWRSVVIDFRVRLQDLPVRLRFADGTELVYPPRDP